MDKELFSELKTSIQEAERIMKGDVAASRRFVVSAQTSKPYGKISASLRWNLPS